MKEQYWKLLGLKITKVTLYNPSEIEKITLVSEDGVEHEITFDSPGGGASLLLDGENMGVVG